VTSAADLIRRNREPGFRAEPASAEGGAVPGDHQPRGGGRKDGRCKKKIRTLVMLAAEQKKREKLVNKKNKREKRRRQERKEDKRKDN
jgi:hypothetical protein